MPNPLLKKIIIGQKAVKELGFCKVLNLALYKLLLKSGYYRLRCPTTKHPDASQKNFPYPSNNFDTFPFTIPTKEALEVCVGSRKKDLIELADEIVSGKWQYYGGMLQPLDFSPVMAEKHWSRIQDQPETKCDLKDIWESSRFCWVYPLGRAYLLTGDERYPGAFLNYYTQFIKNNPLNLGPNWMSAQEVALRLIAFTFAIQVFQSSPLFEEDMVRNILYSIYKHAQRIPPTISYSRAQNNNHIISEAAGLIIAGAVLKGTHQTDQFWKLGLCLFNKAIEKQIDENGNYIQHSTNYHRMMLHLAMLVRQTASKNGYAIPQKVINKLKLATQWLYGMVDEISGFAPNLGHNDGSNIFPLSGLPFNDYRPVLQSASLCFNNEPLYKPGTWDELSLWLGLLPKLSNHLPSEGSLNKIAKTDTRIGSASSWGILRTVHFQDRPAHADQLHVDLWWHGNNIAMDAGTYRYSAPRPWNNALANTPIHNTLSINQTDQMMKAGRFLWLEWAQGQIFYSAENKGAVQAEHDGYHKFGVIHRRELSTIGESNWIIKDDILRKSGFQDSILVSVHWLIPDGEWRLSGGTLHHKTSNFALKLSVCTDGIENTARQNQPPDYQIIRGGEVLFGKNEPLQNLGWYSPTYGLKIPAISFRVNVRTKSNLTLISKFEILPPDAQPGQMV